jgi:hypothetical protein
MGTRYHTVTLANATEIIAHEYFYAITLQSLHRTFIVYKLPIDIYTATARHRSIASQCYCPLCAATEAENFRNYHLHGRYFQKFAMEINPLDSVFLL